MILIKNNTNNNRNLYAVIGVAVLLLGAGIVAQTTSVNIPFLSITNIKSTQCNIGASNVRIDSNDANIGGGKSWVINSVAGCGDSIVNGGAIIPKSSLKGTDPSTGKKAVAKHDFQAGITSIKTFAYNNIQSKNDQEIYSVQLDKIQGTGLGGAITNSDLKKCKSKHSNAPNAPSLNVPHIDLYASNPARSYITGSILTGGDTLYCFYAGQHGTIGKLHTTTHLDFNGKFAMRSNGQTKTKRFDKPMADSGFTVGSGKYKAYVKYIGSFQNNILDINFDNSRWLPACDNSCNNPSNQISWILTDQQSINNYQNAKSNFASTAKTAISNGNPSSAKTQFNNQVDNVFTSKSSQLSNSLGSWVKSIGFRGKQLRIYSNNPTSLGRPDFTFRINAGWVGFKIPVAHPSIVSASNVNMQAKNTASTTVKVKNTGTVSGVVSTNLVCPSPLNGGSSKQRISSGGTQSYRISISSGPSTSRTYTCHVNVKDIDANNVQAQTSINVNVKTNCQDPDGDGICSQNDACPYKAGPSSNNGCPVQNSTKNKPSQMKNSYSDSDGDGVPNYKDVCPNTPKGESVNSAGCHVQKTSHTLVYVIAAGIGLLILLVLGYIFRKPLKNITGL